MKSRKVLLQGGGEGIQSETLGDYAVTYAQEGGQRQSQRMSQTARRFLGSTGLAYRGRDWTDTLWILPPEDGDGA